MENNERGTNSARTSQEISEKKEESFAINPEFPEFFIIKRYEKISFWVKMPDGTEQNIWDFEQHKIPKDLEKALMHAFYIGADYYRMALPSISGRFNNEFVKKGF